MNLYDMKKKEAVTTNKAVFKQVIRQYRQGTHETLLTSTTDTKLFSACRPKIGKDPILWLPMSRTDRSRYLRWRIGWLPIIYS